MRIVSIEQMNSLLDVGVNGFGFNVGTSVLYKEKTRRVARLCFT
jgi:hypothetical protein